MVRGNNADKDGEGGGGATAREEQKVVMEEERKKNVNVVFSSVPDPNY